MERRTEENGPVVRLLKMCGAVQEIYSDYHLINVITGNLRLTIENETFFLNENVILLILPGLSVSQRGSHENLIMDIRLPVGLVQKEIPDFDGQFICNSAIDRQRDYHPLHMLMAKMALTAMENKAAAGVYYKALSYMLLYYLRTNHYEANHIPAKQDGNKFSDRLNAIMAYIQMNYNDDIRLDKMAGYLGLSVSYLSRFFKSAFGESFVAYLKKYRLERSLNELLYSRETITAIAHNHGFYTANAYITAFKEVYETTPYLYRKNFQNKVSRQDKTDDTVTDINKEMALPLLASIAGDAPAFPDELNLPDARHLIIQADANAGDIIPLWNTGINVASAKNFMFNDIYSGIKDIQQNIHFTYGRVSFVFSNQYILQKRNPRRYYFYYLGQVIRTLTDNGLTPYLDLNYDYRFHESDAKGRILVPKDDFVADVDALLSYCIQSFGIEAMESWIFDIGVVSNFGDMGCEDWHLFAERFMAGWKLIKQRVPGARVGGFNIMPAFMIDIKSEILDSILKNGVRPDFISLSVFPYVIHSETDKEAQWVYSVDKSYALHTIRELKRSMEKFAIRYDYTAKIYVNALGTTIIHRNFINDTCYQATFFVKSTIDLLNEVDMICYYQMSDFNFSYTENHLLLNGRNGILSQFGIHKPGYLALRMMRRLSEHMVDRGDGYIVTKGSYDTYHMMLCNHGRVSHSYCLRIDENVPVQDAYTVYDYPDTQNIFITLNHVRDGEYRIISNHLNRENGSLFDEWEKTGFWENPNGEELEYLKTALHPRRNCSRRATTNGQLNFHMHLAPFEVVLIEVGLAE